MRDRLLFAASAVARVVLVVVAFGLAVGSIALSSVRGFCPEITEDTAAVGVLAARGGAATLATIVEEPAEGVDPDSPAPEQQGPTGDQTPSDETSPTDDSSTEDGDGACPGGAQRCLPPLWSSVLILGEPACHAQAPARLRGILVPSFVGATVLLAGAWWLRPSRLHARRREEAPSTRG